MALEQLQAQPVPTAVGILNDESLALKGGQQTMHGALVESQPAGELGHAECRGGRRE